MVVAAMKKCHMITVKVVVFGSANRFYFPHFKTGLHFQREHPYCQGCLSELKNENQLLGMQLKCHFMTDKPNDVYFVNQTYINHNKDSTPASSDLSCSC